MEKKILIFSTLVLLLGVMILFSCKNALMDALEAPELSVSLNGKQIRNGENLLLDSVELGETREYELTITNLGQTSTLLFSETDAMSVRGDLSQFSWTPLSATELSPSGKVTLTVTFSPKGLLGDKTITITLKTNDENESTFDFSLTGPAGSSAIDPEAPTAELTSTTSPVTNDNPIPITLSFSEQVVDFSLDMLTVNGATAENLESSDDITYTFDLTNPQEGIVTVYLPSEKVPNVTGAMNNASNQLEFAYDETSPSTVLESVIGAYIGVPSFDITIEFSEPVTGLSSEDFELSFGLSGVSGSVGTLNSTDGTLYTGTVTFSPSDNPTEITLNLPEGAAQDEAGNPSKAISMPLTVNYDSDLPTVTITPDGGNYINADPPITTLTIEFSEQMEADSFTGTDIETVNCSVQGFDDSANPIYTATIDFNNSSPADGDTISIRIPGGAAKNLAGKNNIGTEASIITYDSTAPSGTMTINGGAGYNSTTSVTYTNSATVDLSFSGSDNIVGESDLEMIVSNLSDFSDAAWEAFTSAKTGWEIDPTGTWDVTTAPAEVTTTIYFKLRDRAGNESPVYSADVVRTPYGIIGVTEFAATGATGTEAGVAVFQ